MFTIISIEPKKSGSRIASNSKQKSGTGTPHPGTAHLSTHESKTISSTPEKAKVYSRYRQKAKVYSRMPKKQKCSHNPRNLAVSIYSHERKKGTPVTRARDGPGSQESLDLAAFPTLHYVFLVIKTTVSTWHEDTELLSHSSCPSVRSGSGTDRGTCPFVRSAPGTDRRVFRPCDRLQELIDRFTETCQGYCNKAPADVYQPGGRKLIMYFRYSR